MGFRTAADAIFRDPTLSESADYDDGSTVTSGVRVIIERGVQVWEGQILTSRDFASVRRSGGIDPKSGHKITVDGTTWKITDEESDDGYVVKFKAKPV